MSKKPEYTIEVNTGDGWEIATSYESAVAAVLAARFIAGDNAEVRITEESNEVRTANENPTET